MDRGALKNFRQRVVGRRETVKHIQRGDASVVYVAGDADPAIRSEIQSLCRTYQIPMDSIDTMRELGQLCGIEVGAACAAVIAQEAARNQKGGRTGANY
ncbi:MAG: ribosomal L7Ae/L30e/S12e/Gadd45 family protein [Thermaerobacter sp.]|nr:ribosomal L7Ae/L30e/S12e/Gadd45 family protein [Thermaerobacter sp.]